MLKALPEVQGGLQGDDGHTAGPHTLPSFLPDGLGVDWASGAQAPSRVGGQGGKPECPHHVMLVTSSGPTQPLSTAFPARKGVGGGDPPRLRNWPERRQDGPGPGERSCALQPRTHRAPREVARGTAAKQPPGSTERRPASLEGGAGPGQGPSWRPRSWAPRALGRPGHGSERLPPLQSLCAWAGCGRGGEGTCVLVGRLYVLGGVTGAQAPRL